MFSALIRLLLVLGLATAVLWIGLPIAASSLVSVALGTGGLHGQDMAVSVSASPPLKLLLLEADTVHIQANDATWRGLAASRLDVTLGGLRLGSAPQTIDGQLDSVRFADASGAAVVADSITLSGAAATPDIGVKLGLAEVATLVGRAWTAGQLVGISVVGLAPPDGLRIGTASGDVIARLSVESDGSLALLLSGTGIPSLRLTVLQPGPALGVRLRSLSIEGSAVVLRGTIDARSLGL